MQYMLLIVIFILLFLAIVAMFFFSYLAKKYYERARDKKLEHIKATEGKSHYPSNLIKMILG
jgi:hypothetical protein